jgi:ADP-ribose pyrophosphatase YjhB (NUDIX family)
MIIYNTEVGLIGFNDKKVQVFLYKNNDDKLCLPGGFVKEGENAKDAIARILNDYINLEQCFMRHIAVFDEPGRDHRGWVVSNVFYIIIKDGVSGFYDIDNLPYEDIAFDHLEIIEKIKENVKKDLLETIIAKYFLEEEFTLKELQELLLCASDSKEISRTHFYTKMKNKKFIEPVMVNGLQKVKNVEGVKKPVRLFRFTKNEDQSSIYY